MNDNEWISVKDRLPELGKPVLVFDRYEGRRTNGSIRQVRRNKNSQDNFSMDPDYKLEPRYTHWMPMPKPPEES